MKKIISILTIFMLLMVLVFTGSVKAASLDAINVQTDKTNVKPGEDVKVTIEFGEQLGAYTFDISYDNKIFDYVSVDGGTANDTTDKIKVAYHDATGGSNPRSNMSVVFKAKADITTSNPTEFTITAEGLANADASVSYDDITTPITKNLTVEPAYIDYTLKLDYTGNILKGQEKDMTISYSSAMGRYYDKARLVAEATTPAGATVKLTAKDDANLEHDIIQSGWGDAQGYKIGGKDVSQVLNAKGLFSEAGDYAITLKLIDRDNSDTVIAQQTFNLTAMAEEPSQPDTTTPEPTVPEPEQQPEEVKPEEMPKKLPKTGSNVYIPVVVILATLLSSYVIYNKRK